MARHAHMVDTTATDLFLGLDLGKDTLRAVDHDDEVLAELTMLTG